MKFQVKEVVKLKITLVYGNQEIPSCTFATIIETPSKANNFLFKVMEEVPRVFMNIFPVA